MKKPPHQLRLDPETDAEVETIAKATGLPKVEVMRQMVAAGVKVIKANGYKLTLPLRLKLDESAVSSPAKKEGTAEQFLDKLTDDLRTRGKGAGASHKPRQ